METFFSTPWRDLDLDDIERFLAEAGDEGLTWEAKGTERPRPEQVRKHVGAFANTEGGFLIVGASRVDGAWRVDPIDFGHDEPGTWLAQVIRSNLRPVPRFDVKTFERESGQVAIVNVDPIAEPPCMTINGEVFARVSGQSFSVQDPATLRRLFERGEGRATAAELEALRAASVPGSQTDPSVFVAENPYLQLRLAFAPTGRLDDVGGRLFTRTFYERMRLAAARLPSSPLYMYPGFNSFGYRTTQDAVIVHERSSENRQRWTIQARWDGSVAAYLDVMPDPEDAPRLLDTGVFGAAVRPASLALTDLIAALGGYGRAHVALIVHAWRFRILSVNGNEGQIPDPSAMLPIQTWTDADGFLADDDLDRMRRELCRASGAVVWEPESEGEAPSG